MVKKWNITIPELTGEQERRLYIYLPESYEYDEERHYPVLYMFDGHNVFFDEDATYGKSWGMADYMDYTETQVIIVAVECNHDPRNGRLEEYAPFDFYDPKFGKVRGRGRITMDWMTGSLKPAVDANLRTIPDRDHTLIAGSSMGGLMSLYAVMEYNAVFARAAALSPSIWTAPHEIDNMLRNCLVMPGTTVYLDYGSNEMRFHPSMQKRFQQVTDLLLARNLWLTCRIVPGGDHCEASWEKQIPFFMNSLLY